MIAYAHRIRVANFSCDVLLKRGYKSNQIDTADQTTLEWRTFLMRRTTKVTATVVSDFLILQTSSGDQSIMYYEETSNAVATEKNFTGKDTGVCSEEDTDYSSGEAKSVTGTYGNHGLIHHNHHDYTSGKKEAEDCSLGWQKMWTSNSLVYKVPTVNTGSYNGLYSQTASKYKGTPWHTRS